MPFGLKNAPQIYQWLLDNALYGFTRITRSKASETPADVFKVGEAGDPGCSSVLGRRSYINDILVTGGSWDQMCDIVEDLLEACDKWNLSISVAKSSWGMRKVDYLGHKLSPNGLEVNPKDLSALADLPFPRSLRSMQSFLGSLNYYNSSWRTTLSTHLSCMNYVDFEELRSNPDLQRILTQRSQEPRDQDEYASVPEDTGGRWARAHRSFETLKAKIATAPTLRHFDPGRPPVVIVYASDWAISAALMQKYDQVQYPVLFVSRTLKSNELNYNVTEKEVLALLRILDLGYNMLVGRSIQVLTRHLTLAWLFRSPGTQGRLGQWAALLSPWTLEIRKCTKGEDEILGAIAASITPRAEVDRALTAIAPRKEPRRQIRAPVPTIETDENLLVMSFDGSARVKRGGGA
ncbi:unnamed protein product [Phytophthora fragariaefolia]|uniref:Unnamed protein product n=1 Tax=Phytophthora fragariaefolia TaxID=1490495 RepID=A0A9W6XWN3_9STRA|nr:unnamed protein product [Phytophthora fragariaefolia]